MQKTQHAETRADAHERILARVERAVGHGWLARVLASEIAMVRYALFGKRGEPEGFSTHRGIGAIYGALIGVGTIELVGVHVLLTLLTPGWAWVHALFAGYGLLWLTADARALRGRPIRFEGDQMHIPFGFRSSLKVPKAQIAGVYPYRTTDAKADEHLTFVTLVKPTHTVVFARPVTAFGVYGIKRQATSVSVTLDEPGAFDAALKQWWTLE